MVTRDEDYFKDQQRKFHSRQLHLIYNFAVKSGVFNMNPSTQIRHLGGGTTRDVRLGLKLFGRLGLLEPTETKGEYRLTLRKTGESKLDYFHRWLRAGVAISLKDMLAWKISRLISTKGVAPHSLQQFADELAVTEAKVSQALSALMWELRAVASRWGGSGGHKASYYAMPHDPTEDGLDAVNFHLWQQYGWHRGDPCFPIDEFEKPKAKTGPVLIRTPKPPAVKIEVAVAPAPAAAKKAAARAAAEKPKVVIMWDPEERHERSEQAAFRVEMTLPDSVVRGNRRYRVAVNPGRRRPGMEVARRAVRGDPKRYLRLVKG